RAGSWPQCMRKNERWLSMSRADNFKLVIAIMGCAAAIAQTAVAFEGRIEAAVTQGEQTEALLYTVGTNFLRVEVAATNSDRSRAGWPKPVDILDLECGALKLLFPHNRSFVRLKPGGENSSPPAGFPQMPAGLPLGVGPQPLAAPASETIENLKSKIQDSQAP